MNEIIPTPEKGCNPDLPLIACDEKIAADAFAVFSLLDIAMRENPELAANSLCRFYAKQAHERFLIAFGGEA